MYTPTHFVNTNDADSSSLIRSFPLSTLVVFSESGFEINHIPFVLDSEEGVAVRLRAHIPKVNPLFELLSNQSINCVAIFQGPESYVSPSWYATKKEHGKVVPTWNYKVVHVHGNLKLKQDQAWVKQQLNDLTNQNESRRPEKWAISDAPDNFVDKQLSVLVGLEVMIARLDSKLKASQNQPAKNRESVLDALESEQPGSEFHKMMKEALDDAS